MSQSILLLQAAGPDTDALRSVLRNFGEAGFRIERLKSCAAGVERLEHEEAGPGTIVAVLVNLDLEDSRGIATFDRLHLAAPQLPFLILAAPENEETARLAVQRGAQDYLLNSRCDAYTLGKALRVMLQRASISKALLEETERARVTLNSIGDAVVSTDVAGRITYFNAVAEGMTGCSCEDAEGRPVEDILRIIDATSRAPVPNPMAEAIRRDETVRMAPNCVLVRRDGLESAIEDSAAPIHDRRGRVTGAVMVIRDVSAARALSLKLARRAQHDSLTELPNRSLLDDRLNQAVALASRGGRKLVLLFLDLDHFKPINDSLGHVVGDRLLQSVAQRLLRCVRSSDTVGRLGGDEFVILLSEVTPTQDGMAMADKILAALRMTHHIHPHDLNITASIGIVTYPEGGRDADELMKNADLAMYQAKVAGGNTYRVFNPGMEIRALEQQSLARTLSKGRPLDANVARQAGLQRLAGSGVHLRAS